MPPVQSQIRRARSAAFFVGGLPADTPGPSPSTVTHPVGRMRKIYCAKHFSALMSYVINHIDRIVSAAPPDCVSMLNVRFYLAPQLRGYSTEPSIPGLMPTASIDPTALAGDVCSSPSARSSILRIWPMDRPDGLRLDVGRAGQSRCARSQ